MESSKKSREAKKTDLSKPTKVKLSDLTPKKQPKGGGHFIHVSINQGPGASCVGKG